MPEGDTIFRTAASLRRWLQGREITAASSQRSRVPAERLVGRRVEAVEARAKHLLVRFTGGLVLHTHMRMTGSWHVYTKGERWRKPAWQARVVVESGDRVAVCFDAPVVELLDERMEREHPALAALGPDVLDPPVDVAEVRRRAGALLDAGEAIGELLLDQRVVSGIGNIYRCEALFLCRLHPWAPWSWLAADELDALVAAASGLMRANVEPARGFDRDFGGGPARPWVYGRAGRSCYRCRTRVEARRSGRGARVVYWCPGCQVSRAE